MNIMNIFDSLKERSSFYQNKVKLFTLANLSNKNLLKYKTSDLIDTYPYDLRPGNPDLGKAWLNGYYPLKGANINNENQKCPFSIAPPNNIWVASLHSFDWARHLIATGNDEAKREIIRTIIRWTQRKPLRNKIAWQPSIIARRFLTWSSLLPAILPYISNNQKNVILLSMNLQAGVLSYTAQHAPDGIERLQAITGLTYSTLTLSHATLRLHSTLQILCRELKRQILSDGGHISRSPDAILPILADLIAIEITLKKRNINIPTDIPRYIKSMREILKFFRYSDGKLCVFNGSLENDKNMIDALLPAKTLQKKSFTFAHVSGYQLLSSHKSKLMIDVGTIPKGAFSTQSHFAPLSFEFQRGIHRIIVNCGANFMNGSTWRQATRGPSAHSTISFPNLDSNFFVPKVKKIKSFNTPLKFIDLKTHARRLEDNSAYWIETSHAGYAQILGLIHQRRLYLKNDGLDLRGEDCLLPVRNKTNLKAQPFIIRFHIHPRIKISLSQNEKTAMLILRNEEGWQFQTNSPSDIKLRLSNSIYMGMNNTPQQNQQITIEGHTHPQDGAQIKWTLKRA